MTEPGSSPATLAELTTLGVGGPAPRLTVAADEAAIVDAVRRAWADGEDPLIVAGGSNTLAGDDGYDGPVVAIRSRGIERFDAPFGAVRLLVQAGEDWDALVGATVDAGWAGIEAMSGIPGSVGAAPVQNIGAYGQEVASTLVAVRLLDRATGEIERVPASELGLGYRTSVLKRHGGDEPARDAVVLAVELELEDTGGAGRPVAFPQLAGALGVALGDVVGLDRVRETVLSLRASKGMVLDADDRDTWSAGSFFTNPIVPAALAASLPSDAPRFPVPPAEAVPETVIPLERYDGTVPAPAGGRAPEVKLSAAWLIEHAGIGRGFSLGSSRAAISSKHTLAITNRGGASAAEVAELARFVRGRVAAEFGVELQPEPVTVDVEL